ncbi:MAG: DUF3800 domain-containing protein [Candidatus Dormibacteraceae bacterium]
MLGRMLLAYVDESYTQDWFTMSALLVDGPAAVALTADLDAVATRAASSYGLPSDVELHGQEIFQARRGWRSVEPRARINIFDDVIEAVAGRDVTVIARAMDVMGQRARYVSPDAPHSVVLQHLLERVDECVTVRGDYALVIADEVDGQAQHRADLSSYREVGTRGYRQRKLTRIVDTLHFAPSHASRLVQAADVITFLFRRVFTHVEGDSRSRNVKNAMWRRLEPRVHHQLCWFPSRDEGQQDKWAMDLLRTHKEPT